MVFLILFLMSGADLGGGCRGCRVQGVQLVFCNQKNYGVYWCWSRERDECTPSWKKSWIRPCMCKRYIDSLTDCFSCLWLQCEAAVCTRWMILNDRSNLKTQRLVDSLMNYSDFIWQPCGKPTLCIDPSSSFINLCFCISYVTILF